MISGVVWCFNGFHNRFGVLMDFIIECKIAPGMELFEQQNFIEEGHEKDYTNLNSLYRTHVHHKFSMT